MLLQDLTKPYMLFVQDQLRMGFIAKSTFTRKMFYIKRLHRYHRKVDMRDFSNRHILQWLRARRKRWKSHVARRDAVSAAQTLFRWAVKEKLIERTPMDRFPKRFRVQPRKPMQLEDYRALMRHLRETKQPELREAFFFLWETGCRPDEMRKAQFGNVDWEKGTLTVYQHKTYEKTGRPRIIALRPKVIRLLRRIHARKPKRAHEKLMTIGHFRNDPERTWPSQGSRSKGRFCFTTKYGRYWKIDYWKERWHAAFKGAGIHKKTSPNCMRHSFTVERIESGASTRQVADLLGHATTHVIDRVYGSHTRHSAESLHKALSIGAKRRRRTTEERS